MTAADVLLPALATLVFDAVIVVAAYRIGREHALRSIRRMLERGARLDEVLRMIDDEAG